MENTCLLVHCVSRFEGTSYKRMQGTANLPASFLLAVLHRIRILISRYHFHNFLETSPTFTEKKLRQEFSFFNGFTQTPTLLTAKIG